MSYQEVEGDYELGMFLFFTAAIFFVGSLFGFMVGYCARWVL